MCQKNSLMAQTDEEYEYKEEGRPMEGSGGLDVTELLMNFANNEPIFDNELLYPTPIESEIMHFSKDGEELLSGTLEGIVCYLTSPEVISYSNMVDFFLTFRSFIDCLPLLELLLCRLSWALKGSNPIAVVRVFVCVRHWILNHFQDFVNNETLRVLFAGTVNEMCKYQEFMQGVVQTNTLRDLKRVFRKSCEIYWDMGPTDCKHNEEEEDILYQDLDALERMPQKRLSTLAMKHLKDPQVRRSSILSMMDSSSIQSKGLHQFLTNPRKQKKEFPSKASLNVFKTSTEENDTAKGNGKEVSSIDLIYNELLNEVNMQRKPLKGVVVLEDSKGSDLGFSVNGDVEVFKDSNIHEIKTTQQPQLPKKADTPTKLEQPVIINKPKLTKAPIERRKQKKGFLTSIFGKRKPLKSIQFHHNQLSETQLGQKNNSQKQVPLSQTKSKPNATKTKINPVSVIQELEKSLNTEDKLDFLGERVLQDYKRVLSYPKIKKRLSKKLHNCNRRSVLSTNIRDSFRTNSMVIDWSHTDLIDDTQHEFVDMKVVQQDEQENISKDILPNNGWSIVSSPKDSAASYVSYNSDLSENSQLKSSNLENGGLRRQNGFNNLRIADPDDDDDKEEITDNSSFLNGFGNDPNGSDKFTAKNLSDSKDMSDNSENNSENNSDSYKNVINEADTNDNSSENLIENGNGKEKVESNEEASAVQKVPSNSSADSLSDENLLIFNELPFNDNDSTTTTAVPSPISSLGQPNYNGISQSAINELAAIPDQPHEDNPLNWTLNKLKGQTPTTPQISTFRERETTTPTPRVVYGLNDESLSPVVLTTSPDSPFMDDAHKKHAIAIVCQSPTKNTAEGEISLEKQVRDLYITKTPRRFSSSTSVGFRNSLPLEMNVLSRSGSVMTRISTSKILLKNDDSKSNFDLQSLKATPKGFDKKEDMITIENIMQSGSHIPFIFEYDLDVIINHLTLIERDILMEIEWTELVNLKWDQPLIPYNSWLKLLLDRNNKKGVQLVTLRFNLMTNWIISEILLCRDITLRVLTITRFIDLAWKSLEIQNFGSLFQIMLAFNSETIRKLSSTWVRVDPRSILKLKKLKDLSSPDGNFRAYREKLSDVTMSKGLIPFLPLELSDLTANSELPTVIKSHDPESFDAQSEREETSENGEEEEEEEEEEIEEEEEEKEEEEEEECYELVNFEKITNGGRIIKSIIRMIEWSRFYEFDLDKTLISKCLYISCLSEDEMSRCLEIIGD